MSDYYEAAYYDPDPYCGQEYCTQEYYIPEYCDQATSTEEYWNQSYCDEGNYSQECCDQEACETQHLENCDEGKYVQEARGQEVCNQETYDQEDYVQDDGDQGYSDLSSTCAQDLIDEENIFDGPAVLTKECEPTLESKTQVYAVIHEFHGFYTESEYRVEGMYSSLEKANAAARRLFKKECRDYLSNLYEVQSPPGIGNRAEWSIDASGAIQFETFDEGIKGFRHVIYVTKRRLN